MIYDALGCNSCWIDLCINLGIDVVVRVKKNKNNSLKEVKVKTNKKDLVETWTDKNAFERIKVYESIFEMDNVDRPLRFIKFAMKYPNKKKSQIIIDFYGKK